MERGMGAQTMAQPCIRPPGSGRMGAQARPPRASPPPSAEARRSAHSPLCFNLNSSAAVVKLSSCPRSSNPISRSVPRPSTKTYTQGRTWMPSLPTRKGMSATEARRKSVCGYLGASSCCQRRAERGACERGEHSRATQRAYPCHAASISVQRRAEQRAAMPGSAAQ